MGIEWKSGVGESGDRREWGGRERESGDRQEEKWMGEGENGDRSGVAGESGDRQEWKGRGKWG